MKEIRIAPVVLAATFSFMGCSGMQLRASADQMRYARAALDPSKSIQTEGMLWVDYPPKPARGVRFPEGKYVLEAEDDEYLYFRAPKPLEFRYFNHGTVIDLRNLNGGLMIRKGGADPYGVAGGGYVDSNADSKIMAWRLARDFLALEGRNWTKSF